MMIEQPDVDAVLAAPDQDLLKLPGVVGMYVCILGHEKSPRLKVVLPNLAP